jgi:hypothetical protein
MLITCGNVYKFCTNHYLLSFLKSVLIYVLCHKHTNLKKEKEQKPLVLWLKVPELFEIRDEKDEQNFQPFKL